MIRLAVRVRGEQSELVLAELLELAPAGVEEVQVEPGVVEYAVYGSAGELPRLPDLDAAVGDALVEISTSELPDDWSERWKRFHRPVLVRAPRGAPRAVPDVRVRPPWEPAGDGRAREIVIDPGQAFGTGAHASTRLCLELLLELAASEGADGGLIDLGTGSGVLAIAAATLGFEPVLALDNDPESVRAARQNASGNGARIEVRRFDLRSEAPPGPSQWAAGAPVVLANLLRPLLLELARGLAWTPAHLLAGGLLRSEADEVAAAFAGAGLRERRRRAEGEWAALWLAA